MSTVVSVSLDCPKCHSRVEGEVVVCLNLSLGPGAADALMADRFNVVPCQACGHRVEYRRAVAALDMSRHLFIYCWPRTAEPYWRDLADLTERAFRRTVAAGAPGPLKLAARRWLVRAVFGYEAVREKLVIVGAALDDVAVEATKLHLMQGRPQWALARLRLRAVDDAWLYWEVARRDGARDRLRSLRTTMNQEVPPDLLPGALGADAFVDARRFFVASRSAPPEYFNLGDLDLPTPGYRSVTDRT